MTNNFDLFPELAFNPTLSKNTKMHSNEDWDVISLGTGIKNESFSFEDGVFHTSKELDELCSDQVKKTRVLESRNQPINNTLTSNISRMITEGTVSSDMTLFLLEGKNINLTEKRGLSERLKDSLTPEHEMRLNKAQKRTVSLETKQQMVPKLIK
jgi:hypothetical protein